MISDAADEVGDGFQIKSLNGETSFSTDHTVMAGTYDNTIMKLTGNSNVTDSKVTVSGDITDDVSLQDGKNINLGTGNNMVINHDGNNAIVVIILVN